MANSQFYSDEYILEFLSTFFEMKTTVQDLKQPKPDFVQKVYCTFLLDFGANMDQLSQLPLDVPESVRQHPHLYSSGSRIMILAKVLDYFLKSVCPELDFYPGDLVNPNPKRTKKFFSYLIDFYECAKDNIDQLLKIEDSAKIKLDAKVRQLEDSKNKEEKLKLLKHESQSNQIREEQMLNRIADVKSEIDEVQATKVNLKSNFDQMKLDITTLITNVKAYELEIIEIKERLDVLASQVIQASERQEIEEREKRLATHRNDNALRSENLAVLKQSFDTCKFAVDLITNELMPILQEIQQEVANVKEYKAGIGQQDRLRRSCIEESEDQEMEIKRTHEMLLSRQEKVSQMQMAWKLKKNALQAEIEQAKASLVEMWRNQTEDEIVVQDLQKERLKIIRETQELKEQFQQFDSFIATNFNKVLQALEKHTAEIQESLAVVAKAARREVPEDRSL